MKDATAWFSIYSITRLAALTNRCPHSPSMNLLERDIFISKMGVWQAETKNTGHIMDIDRSSFGQRCVDLKSSGTDFHGKFNWDTREEGHYVEGNHHFLGVDFYV